MSTAALLTALQAPGKAGLLVPSHVVLGSRGVCGHWLKQLSMEVHVCHLRRLEAAIPSCALLIVSTLPGDHGAFV